MQSFGLLVDTYTISTGKLVRCKTKSKPDQKNGFYTIHLNGDFIYAEYGDWQSGGDPIKWRSKDKLSYHDKSQIQQSYQLIKYQRDQERISNLAKLQDNYNRYVKPLDPQISHEYLDNKGLQDWLNMSIADKLGITSWGDLVVPIRNMDNELTGYQMIKSDGTKQFARGTQKASNFHCIRAEQVYIGEADIIFIGEGVATMIAFYCSMNEYLDCNYVCMAAMDVGNIENVCLSVWNSYSSKHIILIADNDLDGERNIGVETCKQIVQKYKDHKNIKMFIPREI